MRIIVVGDGSPYAIARSFVRALEQLGHEVWLVSEARTGGRGRASPSLRRKIGYRISGGPLRDRIATNVELVWLSRKVKPNIVLVIKGNDVAARVLEYVRRKTGARLVNYSTDDPFAPAHGRSLAVAAIPTFDVYATPRKHTIPELIDAGCRHAIYVPFGYDPATHFPSSPAGGEEARWGSDVAFIGGADRERAALFDKVLQSGIKLHLYGGGWEKYSSLRRSIRGYVWEENFRRVLAGTRVAPCLVRHSNRDGHVMRTFEVPACGAFMLLERTDDHQGFFKEGTDVAMFASDEEFLDKIRFYIKHDAERRRMAAECHRTVTSGKHTYRDRMADIISALKQC